MPDEKEVTPQQPPDSDDIAVLIDPKGEVALAAILAFKRRLEAVELESVVHRTFINNHEERMRKLEAFFASEKPNA